jgi:putative acyl-CoA dehydrogenase
MISNMLNITRVHTGIGAVSAMRRIIALANDYKERRSVFGKPLSQHSLHIHTVARLEKIYRGHLLLLLETGSIL